MLPSPSPVSFAGISSEDPRTGTWMNDDTTEIVHIYKAAIRTDPSKLARSAGEPVYFATKEPFGWTFWTGTRHKQVGALADGRGIYEKTAIDEATVARHKAYIEWCDQATSAASQ